MSLPAAVLWDMDGLMVDTEPLWTQAEHELARRCGGVFTPQAKAAIVGTRLDVAVPRLLQHFGVQPTEDRVEEETAWLLARMVRLFDRPVTLLPGVEELLGVLARADVPQALVSSSYRVLVDAVLAQGMGPFAITLSGDEVAQGKPDPEPYLTAARRLEAEPTHCVVLEDSPSGVAAGQAAGCAVVAVPNVAEVSFPLGRATIVVASLEQVDLPCLQRIAAAARD